MADFYPYLIPSLPMLHFGMKPPFSFEKFLEICREFIPERDWQIIRSLPDPKDYQEYKTQQKTVRGWIMFDTTVRNELAKARAQRMHIEPSPFLRPGAAPDPTLTAAATVAVANASQLDAELFLDEVRWKALDELAARHHFDVDLLITYALKLLLLLRWEQVRNTDQSGMLEHVLEMEGHR